ncbi:MAG: hypothetical protein OXU77_01055 [Gammaproteobacteria bacterium]|nr:hypothetical protein [Gammaproteobacteria bacterium]
MGNANPTIESALDQLRRQWGIDLRRAHAVVALLASTKPVPVADLVVKTGLSRSSIEGIVQCLRPFAQELSAGFIIEESHHSAVSGVLRAAQPSPLTRK